MLLNYQINHVILQCVVRINFAPNPHDFRNMPDIEHLMQEWPPEFNELLKEVKLQATVYTLHVAHACFIT